MRDVVETAINTGMRRQELLGLKWNQIQGGFIHLSKTKTKEGRQMPINAAMEALFKRIRRQKHFTSDYHLQGRTR